ncbi:hypothetical protein COB21_00210 [Candidatus Aerophobetes bacterium]|uniref:Inositol-1-monophosphatase n=1 Tax=Aerophobetes bacterium TaxID=2030807 RepID=A0A2A4X8C6_UNCAE|nr:MAG: hypothetical protein COB21_00210 [Candidatus Aerophobetes bacterium]
MSPDLDLSQILRARLTKVACLAALNVGDYLRKQFGEKHSFETKSGRHNIVTEVDKRAEKLIIDTIKSHFPNHRFIGEESGNSGNSDEGKDGITWLIDPIDGTVNFFHQIPVFCVSIAALFNNETLTGVVYQPLSHELFTAEKDSGAYLNGRKLSVTGTAVLDNMMAFTSFSYNTHENPLCCLDLFQDFAKMGIPIRQLGSSALALSYLAAGRCDGFWTTSLEPYSSAAGLLLVEEAGGSFSTFDGGALSFQQSSSLIATNGLLHDQMVKKIGNTLTKANKNDHT